jgi:hypothetical protein
VKLTVVKVQECMPEQLLGITINFRRKI